MAIVGMCSNESGIENSRMFIGAPLYSFVRAAAASRGSSPMQSMTIGRRSQRARTEIGSSRWQDMPEDQGKRWRQPVSAFTGFYRV
jgi:hypothetical protein